MDIREKDVENVDAAEKQKLNLLLRTTKSRMLSGEEIMEIMRSLSDETLIYARNFRNETISESAFNAIKERAPELSDETLILAAKNDNWIFQEWATNILKERIKTLPNAKLIETVKNKTGILKEAALGVIKTRMRQWTNKKLIETAENGIPETQLLAKEMMKGKGKEVVAVKMKMLESIDNETKKIGAKALTGVKDKKTIKALMRVLSEDKYKTVTDAAAEALNSTEEGKNAVRTALGLG